MNSQNERPSEEEIADHLWRVITALQTMTDHLLTQHGRTARGQEPDAYSLTGLAPA